MIKYLYLGKENSLNSTWKLEMQNDGNLVLYNSGGKAVWDTFTFINEHNKTPGFKAVMQDDGVFAVYDKNNIALWTTWQDVLKWALPYDILKWDEFIFSGSTLYSYYFNTELTFDAWGWIILYYLSKMQTIKINPNPTKLPCKLMQLDCNLVAYDSTWFAYWSSNTYGKGDAPSKTIVGDNGTLLIIDAKSKELYLMPFTPTITILPYAIKLSTKWWRNILYMGFYINNGEWIVSNNNNNIILLDNTGS